MNKIPVSRDICQHHNVYFWNMSPQPIFSDITLAINNYGHLQTAMPQTKNNQLLDIYKVDFGF